MEQFHGTTIISVRRKTPQGDQVAIGGDGQVTLGNIVIKGTARKVRKLHHGKVLAGFAGATADAFTLFERFEAKLEKHQGHLLRSAVELAKDWRTDRVLRRLEAMLAVADHESSLIITGNGDVVEPEFGLVAAWARARGVRVFCNEFGVIRQHVDAASRYRCITDVRSALQANGIGWTLWDYSDIFGITAQSAQPGRYGTRTLEPAALLALGLKGSA